MSAPWLAEHEAAGVAFTPEQREWLEMIRDHVAGSVTVQVSDFGRVPFSYRSGLVRAYGLCAHGLSALVEEFNGVLVAW